MEKLLDYPNQQNSASVLQSVQIQEEMTTQIAEALKKYAKTDNIAVLVKAEHPLYDA